MYFENSCMMITNKSADVHADLHEQRGCPPYQRGCADWGGLTLVFSVDHILTGEILAL